MDFCQFKTKIQKEITYENYQQYLPNLEESCFLEFFKSDKYLKISELSGINNCMVVLLENQTICVNLETGLTAVEI